MPKAYQLTALVIIVTMAILMWVAQAHAATSDATALIRAAAQRHGVPVSFALKVGRQESGNRCGLRGRAGEVGPLQILPATARGLGYSGIRSASCATQVDAGMKHLAKCWRGMNGVAWKAAACHNQGLGTIKSQRFAASARRYAKAVTGSAPVKTAPRRSQAVIQPVSDSQPVASWDDVWAGVKEAFNQPPRAKPAPTRLDSCNWARCPK